MDPDKKFTIIMSMCVILGIILLIGFFIGETTKELVLVETSDIYSLSLGEYDAFAFILGTGSSGQHHNYYFFKECGEGKRFDYVDAMATKIIETDEETPKLKRYEIVTTEYFFSIGLDYKRKIPYNELIVPTNTTQTSFKAEV